MPYRQMDNDAVSLLCFPPHDQVFAQFAAERLVGLSAGAPERLQEALRELYPRAVVRARERFAVLGGEVAWYVYRDGRYSPFDDGPPWWDDPDVAWLAYDGEGRYVDANEAALHLLETDLETLRTMRSGAFTDPATRPTVPWVWALLEASGELHSTSMLVIPSGRRVPVEYRLIRRGDGALSYLREVPEEAVEPSTHVPDTVADADPG